MILLIVTMNLFEYLLYLLFGNRSGELSAPYQPATPEDAEEMDELAQDMEPEEYPESEIASNYRRKTDDLEILKEKDTGETETPDSYWKRFWS